MDGTGKVISLVVLEADMVSDLDVPLLVDIV